MLDIEDILATERMFDQNKLDVRTITMGISLLGCVSDDEKTLCTKIYDTICQKAEHLTEVSHDISREYGVPIIINAKPPTVTGLALSLGFTGRQALIDYQGRPEFADTVTRAKSRCEEYAESRLYDKDGANGAKFSLGCNFGWREVSETKISTDSVKVVIDV